MIAPTWHMHHKYQRVIWFETPTGQTERVPQDWIEFPGHLVGDIMYVPPAKWWPNALPPEPGDYISANTNSLTDTRYQIDQTAFYALHGELTLIAPEV